MESNSCAILCRRLTNALRRHGFRVYLLNYRACTGETPRTLRLYHAGFTEDVEQMLREIRKRDDSPPVYVCGFSLGGNILVNLSGRYSYESLTDDFGIIAAGAVAVLFDAAAYVNTVDSGWKGMLYSSHLVNETQQKVRRIVGSGASSLSVELDAVERVNRVGKLDECLVVPVFGVLRSVPVLQTNKQHSVVETHHCSDSDYQRARRPILRPCARWGDSTDGAGHRGSRGETSCTLTWWALRFI